MSSQSQIIESAPTVPPPRAAGDFEIYERLRDCAAKLWELVARHGRYASLFELQAASYR